MDLGSTTRVVAQAEFDNLQPPVDSKEPFWCSANGKTFKVRKEGYARKRKKGPSDTELYEIVSVDLVKHPDRKITHIAPHLNLPEPTSGDDLEMIRESGLPRLFIMNIQVPSKTASVFGGRNYYSDDPGISLVLVFAVKPETVRAALDPSSVTKQIAAQIALLSRYNQTALTDPDARRRFKAIVHCDNWDHFKIRALAALKGYNGKPIIVNRIGDVFQDETKSEYLEVDVKVHTTQYLARKGIDYFRSKSREAKLRIGFTIQGETEEELPENIFSCCRVSNISLNPKEVETINL